MQDAIQFISAPGPFDSIYDAWAGLSLGVRLIIGAGLLATFCKAIA